MSETSRKRLLPRMAVVCLSDNYGGMEINARLLASRLSRWSEYSVLITRRGTWLEQSAREFGINCFSVPMRWNFSPTAAYRIRAELYAKCISAVIFLGSSEMKTLRFSLPSTVEEFIVRHGTPKRTSKKDVFHRTLWSKVTRHWAISKSMSTNVEKIYPVAGKKILVNYTGQGEKLAIMPFPLEIGGTSEKLKIAHIGRIEAVKGQFDVLEVLKSMLSRGVDAEVTFYGKGRELEKLMKSASDAGLTSHVHFAGQVDAPYQYLNQFHFFVYPSYSEGFGSAFTEAISSGIHCFCYDNTCFPEYRTLGFNYQMFETGDINALSEAVFDTWHRQEPQPIGNRKLAVQFFSDEAEMSRLQKAISEKG